MSMDMGGYGGGGDGGYGGGGGGGGYGGGGGGGGYDDMGGGGGYGGKENQNDLAANSVAEDEGTDWLAGVQEVEAGLDVDGKAGTVRIVNHTQAEGRKE